MKLLGLSVSDFRRIKAIEMQLTDKGLVQIRGRNEQGKSSVLDALQLLLRGPKFINTTDVARHGAKAPTKVSGTFEAHDGTYKVERVASGSEFKLKITHDGKTITQKPQTFLDTLINELTFDPRPFVNKSDAEKLNFMKKLLQLDTSDIDRKVDPNNGTLYNERLVIGRKRDAIGVIEIPPEPIVADVAELNKQKDALFAAHTKERDAVEQFNKEQEVKKVARTSLASKLEKKDAEKIAIKELIYDKEAELRVLHSKLLVVSDECIEAQQALDKAPQSEPLKPIPVFDPGDINDRIADAARTQTAHAEWQQTVQKAQQRQVLDNEYKDLTQEIERLRSERRARIVNTKIPVVGLTMSVDDGFMPDGVYHNGIHSSGWSESQSMRISAELCVAMQPELKCLFIDKGEAYDKIALKALHDWCVEHDIQAMITIVDSDLNDREDGAIYIEDGGIV